MIGTDARPSTRQLIILAGGHASISAAARSRVWWRCHRRIIADYLLASGVPVAHIMGRGKVVPAKLTPGIRSLPGGKLIYPGGEGGPVDDSQTLLALSLQRACVATITHPPGAAGRGQPSASRLTERILMSAFGTKRSQAPPQDTSAKRREADPRGRH